MSDPLLLRGLLILASLYGAARMLKGEWSGAILCLGVAAMAFAS